MNLTLTATMKHTLKSRLLWWSTIILLILKIRGGDDWIEKRSSLVVKNMTVLINGKPWNLNK